MKDSARRAWERVVAFQQSHGSEPLHTLLCLTWLPFGVLVGGGLVTWAWLSTPLAWLALTLWSVSLTVASLVGASMQGSLGALIGNVDRPFPTVVHWLWSLVWVTIAFGLTRLGGWPFWLLALAFGLTVSALQNELLVPMLLAYGPAAVGRLARLLLRSGNFLWDRLLLGVVAVGSATAFVTSPLLVAAGGTLILWLWVVAFFTFSVGHTALAALALALSVGGTGLAVYGSRRFNPLLRGLGVALKACMLTAVTGFRKVLMTLVGWAAVGFSLTACGRDLGTFFLLLDGYLNLLLALLLGRLVLAGLTPALLFLRFYSLGWLAEVGALEIKPLEASDEVR